MDVNYTKSFIQYGMDALQHMTLSLVTCKMKSRLAKYNASYILTDSEHFNEKIENIRSLKKKRILRIHLN